MARATGVSKLFQTRSAWGLVVCWLRGVEAVLLMLIGRIVGNVQKLRNNTGSTIAVALQAAFLRLLNLSMLLFFQIIKRRGIL